ncbi:MAG: TIGR02147 family protein [Bdellovibrionaceae bacterium]|nr:TIGR02147 family protein [Pseudobdellovibrionaceae bacterium]
MDSSTTINVFLFTDYKQFLKSYIDGRKNSRGLSKKMADAAQCQPSYLSQALHSKVQLTPDQAMGIAQFIQMDPDEREYFLILVDWARAHRPELKKLLHDKIKGIQNQQSDLSKKLQRPPPKNMEHLVKYYSSWVYAYVHVLTSIPEYQSVDAISKKIFMTIDETFQVLSFLESVSLVRREGTRWVYTSVELHVDAKSPLIANHHNNWRSESVKDSQFHDQENSVHFTGVYSVSKSDFPVLKELILATIKSLNSQALASGTEDLIVFCCDYFKKTK